jgi:hypothetical protein
MRNFRDRVNSVGYEYRPYHQNSNSFAAGALRHAGLLGPGTAFPEAFDHVIAVDPDSGKTNSVFVPGFDRHLTNPINEFANRFGNWTYSPSGASSSDTNLPSAFEIGAPAVPFVPSDRPASSGRQDSFDDRFGGWPAAPPASAPSVPLQSVPQSQPGNSTRGDARNIRVLSSRILPHGGGSANGTLPANPDQPSARRVRPAGLFTGQPVPDYPVPPQLFSLPDRSAASGDDMDDWFARWIKPLLQR